MAMKKGGATYFYHYNAHGDVIALTDAQGNVVARYEYDTWGQLLSQSGEMADENPYRYAGYQYDNETGLYYLICLLQNKNAEICREFGLGQLYMERGA
ncbi:YD repeat-containing protein [Anoxybacillus tengchongensis]|uniref:YD repeat-containing protein n=1 Tax=Anoxybacillus tengchongensis TaxID=576944 RepID=A0A7X0DA99_9BACL|nr:YD repeat-containing protein [Anoxybacillus tengchongensis]